MNWIKYLLEANLYLALFYAAYYLLLRRETHYQLNRVYLLCSSLMAFIIPLTQLSFLKPAPGKAQSVQMHDAASVVIAPYAAVGNHSGSLTTVNYYVMVYFVVSFILMLLFSIRVIQLVRLAKTGRHISMPNFKLVEISEDNRAFSFFNYLFIGRELSSSSTVIEHELVHIRQYHSADIIYLELLKIICWFNPVVYLLQHSLKEVHEFIADSHIATSQQNVDDYTDFLIGNAYGLPETALTNNFFNHNLLKTRIMMLHQKPSGSLAKLKYLLALPLLAGMLCISTLGFTKNYAMIDLTPAYAKVIDSTVKAPPMPQHTTPPPPPVGIRSKAEQVTTKSPVYTHNRRPPAPVPLPAPDAKIPAAVNPANPDTTLPFDALYFQLAKNLIYPREARDKHVVGTIYLTFTIGADSKVQDIKVMKGLGSGIDEATISALKKCTAPADAKTDLTYVIPVSFYLTDPSGKLGSDLSGDNTVPALQSNQVLLKAITITGVTLAR